MKILIFEDEGIVSIGIRDLLFTLPQISEVLIVANYQAFKDILARQKFDLAFVDVNIRGELVGIEAGAYLRKNYNMGLIYLTAYTTDEVISGISKNIPDAYIVKPFDETHLLNVTKQVYFKYKNADSPLGQISISQQEGAYLASKIEFYQDLIDQIYIVSITDSSGHIIYVNDAFCKLSGFARNDLIGHKHKLTNSNYHPPDFFNELWDKIKNGQIWHGEIRNKTKTDEIYWVECYIFPLRNSSSPENKHFVSIGHDISAKKILQDKVDELLNQKSKDLMDIQHQFNRLTKDNSMIGFNTVLVHEIKRPLATFSMQIELMINQLGPNLPDKYAEKLTKFKGNIQHLLGLINYLNEAFKRKNTDKREDIDLIEDMQAIIDFTKMIFPTRTPKFTFEYNLDKSIITGYRDSVFLSFFNLLKNASEAFKEEQTDRQIHISLTEQNDLAVVMVKDNVNGGIPEDIRKNLFKNSFVSQKQGGSGLGLNICRQALKTMDAEILLCHSDENGSTFKIMLPLSQTANLAKSA
jgi:PAS domain S-box-containing protein